jgi:hypothetical protein
MNAQTVSRKGRELMDGNRAKTKFIIYSTLAAHASTASSISATSPILKPISFISSTVIQQRANELKKPFSVRCIHISFARE